jgi:iron complex outermembrane recepter protein
MLRYILLFFIATNAYAQVELETIEVEELQGDKEEKTYLETNESVSVLKSQNSLQLLSGLSNVQQSSKDENSFSIRGISDMGVTGFQKDNLASVMVDGVFQTPLSLRAGSFEQWDLQTIEVHRGAQSTTQGVNSLAGNILLFHHVPEQRNSGAAKVALGNYGRKETGLVLNHSIKDNIFVRASYNKELYDGYIKNKTTGNDKWGHRNKDHFATDLLMKLGKDESLRFNLKVLRFDRGGEYVQGNNYEKYEVTENNDFNSTTNGQQASLTYEKRFSSSVTNKTIVAFTRADSNSYSDADGTPQNTAGERYENFKDSFMSLENVVNFKGKNWKNALGLHMHRYKLDEFYDFNLLFPIGGGLSHPVAVTQSTDKEREVKSFFDSFIYELNEHNSVDVGGRIEFVENDYGAGITGQRVGSTGNAGVDASIDSYIAGIDGKYGNENTNTMVLPRLAYTYKNGNYSLGALYTEGYRTGGLSINRRRASVSEYDPEKTKNYELSWKLKSEKVLFTTNVFYTQWLDQQVETRLSNDTYDTQVRNASTSQLFGAEVEGNAELDNGDSVRANIGTVKTQFLSFNNNGTSYTGNEFPDAAKFSGQLSYWKTFQDDLLGIVTTRFLSKSWSDPENTRRSPEQVYLDANLQYFWKDFVIEGFVRNILDKNYRIYDGRPRSTTTPYQAAYHRMSPPREFGARLNYFW